MFLTGIRDVLVKQNVLPNTHSYIYKSHSKNEIIKRISIAANDPVKRFYEYLYFGNPKYYMKRKKEKFEELFIRKWGQYERRESFRVIIDVASARS